jgi:hypothetical protein
LNHSGYLEDAKRIVKMDQTVQNFRSVQVSDTNLYQNLQNLLPMQIPNTSKSGIKNPIHVTKPEKSSRYPRPDTDTKIIVDRIANRIVNRTGRLSSGQEMCISDLKNISDTSEVSQIPQKYLRNSS